MHPNRRINQGIQENMNGFVYVLCSWTACTVSYSTCMPPSSAPQASALHIIGMPFRSHQVASEAVSSRSSRTRCAKIPTFTIAPTRQRCSRYPPPPFRPINRLRLPLRPCLQHRFALHRRHARRKERTLRLLPLVRREHLPVPQSPSPSPATPSGWLRRSASSGSSSRSSPPHLRTSPRRRAAASPSWEPSAFDVAIAPMTSTRSPELRRIPNRSRTSIRLSEIFKGEAYLLCASLMVLTQR